MIVKILDAFRFLLPILLSISTMAVFLLLVKDDLKDKSDD
jgi:hypothetical protein